MVQKYKIHEIKRSGTNLLTLRFFVVCYRVNFTITFNFNFFNFVWN